VVRVIRLYLGLDGDVSCGSAVYDGRRLAVVAGDAGVAEDLLDQLRGASVELELERALIRVAEREGIVAEPRPVTVIFYRALFDALQRRLGDALKKLQHLGVRKSAIIDVVRKLSAHFATKIVYSIGLYPRSIVEDHRWRYAWIVAFGERPKVCVAVVCSDGLHVLPPINNDRLLAYIFDDFDKVVDYLYEDLVTMIASLMMTMRSVQDLPEGFIEEHESIARVALENVRAKSRQLGATALERRILGFNADEIRKLYDLEKRGRELAYELAASPLEIFHRLSDIAKWSDRVLDALQSIRKRIEESEVASYVPKNLIECIEMLRKLFEAIKRDAEHGVPAPSAETVELMRRVDKAFRNAGLGGVAWGNVSQWCNLVNSATAAYHKVLDVLSTLNRGYIVLTSNPYATRWARAFLETLNLMIEKSRRDASFVVAGEDVAHSMIGISDEEVWMRLGTAPGHAARIDLARGVLKYFDTDEDVKNVLLKLIERFVPIKSYSMDENTLIVEFEPTPENVEKLCAILPLAISMDFRLRDVSALATECYSKAEEKLRELGLPKESFATVVRTAVNEVLSSDGRKLVDECIRKIAPDIVVKIEKIASKRSLRIHS